MEKIEVNGLEYYRFDDNPFNVVAHGFFTRNGGVSPAPWNSLNLSTTGGDSRKNVIENRERIFKVINKPVESLFDTWQVHGNKIIETITPRGIDKEPEQADGIITNNPEVTLFMRFADCVPLLFIDKKLQVAGIAHAGWKGTINKIAEKMVTSMSIDYGLNPVDICVGIGPCISREKYTVKQDVLSHVKELFPYDWHDVISEEDERMYFDLVKTNKIILENAGVKNIILSNLCTASNLHEWFSHRAENGSTGRFAVFISPGERY